MYHCTTTLDAIVLSHNDRSTRKLKYLKNVALEGSALLRTCKTFLSFTTISHSSTHIIKDKAFITFEYWCNPEDSEPSYRQHLSEGKLQEEHGYTSEKEGEKVRDEEGTPTILVA